jgi:anti-anti-sigma factor
MDIRQWSTDEATIVSLSGRPTLGDDERLRTVIENLLQQGHSNITLNLAGLDYTDSAVLGAIVRLSTTVSRKGGTMKLAGMPGIRDLFTRLLGGP